MTIIPPIKTQGIKTKLVDFIRENLQLNDDGIWIEPFMGSGVVGFNLAGKNAIFSDTNPYIIKLYNQLNTGTLTSRIVREYLEKEGNILEEKGEQHYKYVRDRFNESGSPLDFLFLNRSCFNGMIRFNRKGGFNVPFCKKPNRFAKAYITKIVNQVENIQLLMKQNNWSFICQDFEKTIGMGNKDCFIYCDPPYIGRHVDYFDSWSEENEIKLKEALSSFGGKFIVSTRYGNSYRHNEYLGTLWKDFNIKTTEHFYFVGGKETNRNSITEALIMNY